VYIGFAQYLVHVGVYIASADNYTRQALFSVPILTATILTLTLTLTLILAIFKKFS